MYLKNKLISNLWKLNTNILPYGKISKIESWIEQK